MPKGCPLSHEALVRTAVEAGRTRFRFVEGDRFWDPLPLFHMSFILPLIGVLDAGGTFVSMTHFEPAAALATARTRGRDRDVPDVPGGDPGAAQPSGLPRRDAEFGAHHEQRRATGHVAGDAGSDAASRADQRLRSHRVRWGRRIQRSRRLLRAADDHTGASVRRDRGLREGRVRRGTPTGRARRAVRARLQRVRGLLQGSREDRRGVRRRRLVPHRRPRVSSTPMGGSSTRVGSRTCSRSAERTSPRSRSRATSPPTLRCRSQRSSVCPTRSTSRSPPRSSNSSPAPSRPEEEIIDYCTGAMSRFKVPRHVRFVTEWPMSATKIQKFRLRDQLAEELGLA